MHGSTVSLVRTELSDVWTVQVQVASCGFAIEVCEHVDVQFCFFFVLQQLGLGSYNSAVQCGGHALRRGAGG